MRIDRLARVITILQGVDPRRFDMGDWICYKDCGTAACAVGWATQDPKFIAEGLHFSGISPTYVIGEEKLKGYDAVEVFFELTHEQALHLFSPGEYDDLPWNITPTDVIGRIQAVIDAELKRRHDEDIRRDVEQIEHDMSAAAPDDEAE